MFAEFYSAAFPAGRRNVGLANPVTRVSKGVCACINLAQKARQSKPPLMYCADWAYNKIPAVTAMVPATAENCKNKIRADNSSFFSLKKLYFIAGKIIVQKLCLLFHWGEFEVWSWIGHLTFPQLMLL